MNDFNFRNERNFPSLPHLPRGKTEGGHIVLQGDQFLRPAAL